MAKMLLVNTYLRTRYTMHYNVLWIFKFLNHRLENFGWLALVDYFNKDDFKSKTTHVHNK